MKNLTILAAGALACAVAASCVQPNGAQSAAAPYAQQAAQNGQTAGQMAVAYINTDSVMAGYKLAVKLSNEMNGKAETARANFNQKAQALAEDVQSFQQKVQYNAFSSMERAQSEQQRLQKAQADLEELNNRLSNDLMREQAQMSAQLADTVRNFLKEYAKGRYALILSNNMGDNVLYSEPGVDITAEVVAELNARYKEK